MIVEQGSDCNGNPLHAPRPTTIPAYTVSPEALWKFEIRSEFIRCVYIWTKDRKLKLSDCNEFRALVPVPKIHSMVWILPHVAYLIAPWWNVCLFVRLFREFWSMFASYKSTYILKPEFNSKKTCAFNLQSFYHWFDIRCMHTTHPYRIHFKHWCRLL